MVFLDFNHHYAMGAEHHANLISMLQEVFGSKLCRTSVVEAITLDFLWGKKYQVTICTVLITTTATIPRCQHEGFECAK